MKEIIAYDYDDEVMISMIYIRVYIYIYIYIYRISLLFIALCFHVGCVCIAVTCPANSDGDDVPAGCMCNAGYSGSVTASTDAPFYEGSCAGTVCLGSEIAARQYAFPYPSVYLYVVVHDCAVR